MKLHVLLSPQNVDDLYFSGKTTVVIDILRATTVITKALFEGAKEIIPVGSIDFAMKISGNSHDSQFLLCGERNTKMIEGFNLGNSPQDYTSDKVKGKSIILFTTNGSKAIVKAKFSSNLITCSFNNLASVAQHLVNLGEDAQILCSGNNGMFSIEDTACAGRLISEIQKLQSKTKLTDAAKASVILSNEFASDIITMLRNCEHGKILKENGFNADIKFCSKMNNLNVIPFFDKGVIKLLNEQASSSNESLLSNGAQEKK